MNTSAVGSTVRVGNHALSAAEAAAGAPAREPYVGDDLLPVDPDTVEIELETPDRVIYRFHYPTVVVGDEGLVQQESTGRFYVDWTPVAGEDGTWKWRQKGASTGSSVSDQGEFFVQRPLVGVG